MRQSHKDHGVLLERWQKINQYVLSPRLPYAHLMADGPPHKEGERVGVCMKRNYLVGSNKL